MDYKIIWSPDALFEAPQSLIHHPKIGRIVPEVSNEFIRELFVFQYRIVYEIQANEIHILTVIHGKRIFDKEKSNKPLEIDTQQQISVQSIIKHRQFILFKTCLLFLLGAIQRGVMCKKRELNSCKKKEWGK